MFQLIEKAGERKAVYSKSDLAYMQARGWRPVAQVAAILKPAPEKDHVQMIKEVIKTSFPDIKPKRKYTRRAK